MARTFMRRLEFDRNHDFFVTKPLLFCGKNFNTGDTFDKTLATTRRLRQMYDNRMLDMREINGRAAPAPTKNTQPQFTKMSVEELRTWLNGKGVIPHPRADKRKLVARAKRVLKEEAADGSA